MRIKDAEKREGKEVSITGWVYRKRGSGGIIFAVIRDTSGIMQAAVKKDNVDGKSWKSADGSAIESSVKVTGTVKKDERAPTGYELQASSFKNFNISEPFPITEYQSPELLLDNRHLWLRSRKMTQVMRARTHVFRYAREFLDRKGFYEVTPPVITMSGGETGADMFEINYFGQKAYLTESSQLYAEAMIFSLEKVYSLVPSFRAEKSRTVKHLAEYWHLEPEMAHYDNRRNMKVQERLVSHVASRLAEKDEDILKEVGVSRESLQKIKPPFKRVKYEDALRLLAEKGTALKWGDDFGVPEEKLLTEDEEKPIFIYDFPKELKAFYMPINPKDPRTVLASDMLAPHGHGEIIGGSERIWKMDQLLERMQDVERQKNITFDRKKYEWWIDLRKYGSVPHSGFGMGMERLIKWMLNLDHIRDAIPFPRMMNRAYP